MKFSLKLKYSIFLALLLLLTVVTLSIFVLRGIRINQKEEYEKFLCQQAKVANSYINQIYAENFDENNFLYQKGEDIVKYVKSISGLSSMIFDMKGKKVVTNNLEQEVSYNEKLLYYALENKIAYEEKDGYIIYMAPIYHSNQIGVIKFQYNLKAGNDFYKKIKGHFIYIGTIVFILSFIGAYIYFDRYAKIILQLKKYTDKIKQENFKEVKIVKRNDELGELSEGIFFMSNQISNNIKEMKREQRKLNLAVKKLKKLEKQQRIFIGNITHEFKTPLTVIKAYLDLLDMYGEDTNLLQDAKSNIRKESEVLQNMVEKILILSSMEKYDFELQSEKINIKELVEEMYYRMKRKAEKFNINIEVDLKNAFILGDKEGLVHIFINLIDNAIKYNIPYGGINITNYIKEDLVCIEISDTGIGIPYEEREKIFEPFYRGNVQNNKKYEGTGIGLSLVKELVEKQNGNISLMNTNGNGTKFLIIFPIIDDYDERFII